MLVIFRTVLLLSAAGAVLTLILLALKPITSRVFSAKWRYYMWIAVLAVTVIPLPFPHRAQAHIPSLPLPALVFDAPAATNTLADDIDIGAGSHAGSVGSSIDRGEIAAIIWIAGMCVSYARFIRGKKLSSLPCEIDISAAAKKAGVKKVPRVRICADASPPMLTGILHPVIYLSGTQTDASLEAVLIHELTHYRRRDLIYKFAALIVNGIHWFNPLMYVAAANINEECEISCDAEITGDMTDEEKKVYMNTILNLIHR